MSRILGVGVLHAFGDQSSLPTGSGVRESATLSGLPSALAGLVPGPDLGPWLARKKDARLLPRAAMLALPAAGRALGLLPDEAREHTAIYVAVGREPPDDSDAEPSLAAMADEGRFDVQKVGGRGRELYPPLLPLKTLPNMILAHVAILHGLRGENGTFAGGPEAGRQALRAGQYAVDEGRAPFAVVGAAYSATDLGSARDRLRLGLAGAPGEGAAFMLLGPGSGAWQEAEADWAAILGDCGPVGGLWPYCLSRATA